MSDDDPKSSPPSLTRRKFLLTSGSGVAASLVAGSGSSEMAAFAPNPEFSKHSFGGRFIKVR